MPLIICNPIWIHLVRLQLFIIEMPTAYYSITIADTAIQYYKVVWRVRVFLDNQLQMKHHVNKGSNTCY